MSNRMNIQTEVLGKRPVQFNMVGQSLPRQLYETDERISNRIVNRLYPYATKRLKEEGFGEICSKWKPSIYTIEWECTVENRSYCVRWTNDKGGYIELVGILINKWGTPQVDHNFEIGFE